MLDWFDGNKALVYWLTGASVVMFVGTMVATPIVLVRLPADYFQKEKREKREGKSRPVLKVLKNVLGAVLLLAGLAMLLLPGQGLLCVLLGVILLDFPGKYRVERWILGRKKVLGAINWMRKKAGKEPMRIGDSDASTHAAAAG
jgi:hypothetical protein